MQTVNSRVVKDYDYHWLRLSAFGIIFWNNEISSESIIDLIEYID